MKTEKTTKLDWTEAQEIADVILQIENTEEGFDKWFEQFKKKELTLKSE
jgi:hypothetical protein